MMSKESLKDSWSFSDEFVSAGPDKIACVFGTRKVPAAHFILTALTTLLSVCGAASHDELICDFLQ
jgi:hypothetical protein